MPRFSTRPVFALLGALALLCLAACAPAATASVSPTATVTSVPTLAPTPTLAPAPTPTNVPDGWSVLVGWHFSLAYPPGWTPQTVPQQDGSVLYLVIAPNNQMAVRVLVQDHEPALNIQGMYCPPASGEVQHITLAGLPMTYTPLSGEGQSMRSWAFVNAQATAFALDAGDAQSSNATQAQDESILATFRPDNATPWTC